MTFCKEIIKSIFIEDQEEFIKYNDTGIHSTIPYDLYIPNLLKELNKSVKDDVVPESLLIWEIGKNFIKIGFDEEGDHGNQTYRVATFNSKGELIKVA
jgi:hypothetical protein